MGKGRRVRRTRKLPNAVVELRGARWIQAGELVCRIPAPWRVKCWLMNRVFLPRLQCRSRLGNRATAWRAVGGEFV